jgi:hypothetical protein
MASNYERKFYGDYEKATKDIDALKEMVYELKDEIQTLKRNNAVDISALKAEHAREIKSIRAAYEVQISALKSENKSLKEEVRKLRAQIDKNSSNSSKPPSSDGFKKIPNSREKTGRKSGGQKGHKGNIPILFENPDEINDLRPAVCSCGGAIEYLCDPVRKQVVDFRVVVHVSEFVDGEGVCLICGKKHKIKFPEHVHNPVSIGDSVRTLTSMLHSEYAMPLNKILQFASDLTEGKLKLSEGTIINSCKKLSTKIEPSIESIKEKLFTSDVLHKDETGVRVNGKLNWMHTLTTKLLTLYSVNKKRGNEADQDMGVLPGFSGTLMHDHLIGLYDWNCRHAECNAHILRYLQNIIENEPEYAAYAKQMAELFRTIHKRVKAATLQNEEYLHKRTITTYSKRYDKILERWQEQVDKEVQRLKKVKNRYKREGEKLCARLTKYKEEHLLFMCDFKVPFDNNLAERALRGIKTKTKVSGGFRTQSGGETYATIRSYIETLRRQDMNIHQGIAAAFSGEPILF